MTCAGTPPFGTVGGMAPTAVPLIEGTTYTVTYRPTLYAKPVTRTALRLTTILVSSYNGKKTYIFHGPRGGKVVLGEGEIDKVVA